jgi:hypothetical protein
VSENTLGTVATGLESWRQQEAKADETAGLDGEGRACIGAYSLGMPKTENHDR